MRTNLLFDWVDALLFASGFVITVAVLGALKRFDLGLDHPLVRVGASVLFVGPVFVRRRIFGPPKARAPREGAIWSALSMMGLLGVLTLAAASFLFSGALENAPDFEAVAHADFARTAGTSYADLSFHMGHESPSEQSAREAREVAERAASDAAATRDAAQRARREWQEHRDSSMSIAVWCSVGGLCAIMLGALLAAVRFERRKAAGF